VKCPKAIAAALGAAAISLGLAACGDEDGAGAPVLGGPAIDTAVQLANCTDWEDATVEERLGTINQIENFVGGPVGNDNGVGNTLTDDQAYDVMEGWCGEQYSRGFRLYKLYTRAAAFTPPQQ